MLFDQLALHEGDRVLDVAFGTGIVTRVAVERHRNLASIVGFDFNGGMLEVAKANTPTTDTPIEWQQGDMCALPFPDDAFDVVLCQQGLQFAPDKLAALCHMRRVLSPDGRLAFTVWSEVYPLMAATVEEVRAALQSYRGGDDFVMPARSHLVQARAS
ncbi:MAG: methyltransferase domain-containing protein [bacterium]|nr:methyltransferase domain-containing protein [bacterium]